MYGELELMELEDFEDFEDFEEYEDFEDEADPFLGSLAQGAMSLAKQVPWGKVVRSGADILASSLNSESESYDQMAYMAELAADSESEAEADQFIGALASIAGSALPALLKESSYKDFEDYEDFEYEADPFLPLLLPLAANILPAAIPLVKKGIQAVGKAMRESDPSKKTLKTLPIIAIKVIKKVANDAKSGQPISKNRVNATIVKSTKQTLANPRTVTKAVKTNRKAAARAVKRAKADTKVTRGALRKKRLMAAR